MKTFIVLFFTVFFISCKVNKKVPLDKELGKSGNPIFEGWYADPEAMVFDDTYWVYPTYSSSFENQLFFDAFSSNDLVNWTKHERILDTTKITWLRQALWAPSIIKKDDKYYLFFGANDVQRPGRSSYDPNNDINHFGGIGIAVADSPGGPFKDYLGKPLIADFYNDTQPIDQFVFEDVDGTFYIFYGGWSHYNLGKLNNDFTGIEPWEDGSLFKEITPEGYVEGPFAFLRNGIYYFMWSEGNWTDSTYKVAYSMSNSITGPFKRIGTILESDPAIATGAGHHSVINVPNTDEWLIVYHRRPIPNEDRDHRVTSIDKMEFRKDGTIKPVKITNEGVEARPLR
ncbi:glycoside hydrolase family 43 protein [Maribacter hydrothermalis]|uniref:Arabinan endo-1,5-alpha-L-arabinosidase n=1 Tax=Maribacter hydrothermalis TaxID=1836467 RepID=A0A1B7ZC45_9FLAO|nr:glycoside hydrolase family 43 protein [Maribacter hydrothermalis]APQ19194.1 arabinan endo-1,5-alpha-L-arabinosidase [Maribacter hydrothermalis]OBR40455.1 arabinan endo-1,5-alpha-L-arabinosidase [Maribacter hydrothermalis]